MADPNDLAPTITTGLPPAIKARPRSDFKPSEFDIAIQTKGYDLWWSRYAPCPCLNNDQTEQPSILCKLCKGDGFYAFLPDPAVAAGKTVDQYGNPIEVHPNGKAVKVRGIMTSLTQDVQVFEKFGEWVFGTARLTTQAGNRLGYRDRVTAVESEMVWSERIEYDGGNTIRVTGERNRKGLRYPCVRVHDLRSVETAYRQGLDFVRTPEGEIMWLDSASARPAANTRLTIHGTVHPTWVVMDHVNTYRDTKLEGGTGSVNKQKFETLPTQAVVKLDFLVNQD